MLHLEYNAFKKDGIQGVEFSTRVSQVERVKRKRPYSAGNFVGAEVFFPHQWEPDLSCHVRIYEM